MAAGTRQQHVNAPVVRVDMPDKAVPGLRAGSIAHQDQAAGYLRHLFQRLTSPADQHQPCAFLGVQLGTGCTDAGAGPGDHHRARLSHGDTPCG